MLICRKSLRILLTATTSLLFMANAHAQDTPTTLYEKTIVASRRKIPVKLTPKRAAKEIFSQYTVGLTTGDLPLILGIFDEMFAMPGYPEDLSREQIATFYTELFGAYDLKTLKPTDIYLTNSEQIIQFDTNRVMLTVKSTPTAPLPLSDWLYWDNFWGTTHRYFFEKSGSEWKMIAFAIDSGAHPH